MEILILRGAILISGHNPYLCNLAFLDHLLTIVNHPTSIESGINHPISIQSWAHLGTFQPSLASDHRSPSIHRASEFFMVTLKRMIRSTWNLVVLRPATGHHSLGYPSAIPGAPTGRSQQRRFTAIYGYCLKGSIYAQPMINYP